MSPGKTQFLFRNCNAMMFSHRHSWYFVEIGYFHRHFYRFVRICKAQPPKKIVPPGKTLSIFRDNKIIITSTIDFLRWDTELNHNRLRNCCSLNFKSKLIISWISPCINLCMLTPKLLLLLWIKVWTLIAVFEYLN